MQPLLPAIGPSDNTVGEQSLGFDHLTDVQKASLAVEHLHPGQPIKGWQLHPDSNMKWNW